MIFPDVLCNLSTLKQMRARKQLQADTYVLPITYFIFWNSVIEIDKNDVNIYSDNYLSKVNSLIMSHVPIKNLNKQQRKSLQKPQFTTAIENLI